MVAAPIAVEEETLKVNFAIEISPFLAVTFHLYKSTLSEAEVGITFSDAVRAS